MQVNVFLVNLLEIQQKSDEDRFYPPQNPAFGPVIKRVVARKFSYLVYIDCIDEEKSSRSNKSNKKNTLVLKSFEPIK